MNNLKIYVCGHNNLLNYVPDLYFIQKVNLNNLDIGRFQSNQLAESRIFLSDQIKEPSEYVGFLSQRYRQKWPHLASFKKLNQLEYKKETIFYAETPPLKWKNWFNGYCPGMDKLFYDMVDYSGLNPDYYPTVINNCFICHWDIFQEFLVKWKDVFNYIYEKYPPDTMTFETYDNSRRAGCLYESLSSLIFANLIKKYKLNFESMRLNNKSNLKRILL